MALKSKGEGMDSDPLRRITCGMTGYMVDPI